MLELYHFYGAICGLKARLAIAEKGLTVVDHALGRDALKRPDYLAINRNGTVPTLVHDGAVVTESTVILTYLDEIDAARPLRPADPLGRARALWWMKRADDCLIPVGTLTYTISMRPALISKSDAELEAWLDEKPDPASRAKFSDILKLGFDNPAYAAAAETLIVMLSDMGGALATGPWLAGPAFTLADIAMTPLVERLDELAMGDRWRERFPAVEAWWERVKARPSYTACVTLKPNPEAKQHTEHGRACAAEIANIFDRA